MRGLQALLLAHRLPREMRTQRVAHARVTCIELTAECPSRLTLRRREGARAAPQGRDGASDSHRTF
eukprot:1733995-Pleurochrysis_carterae.AAC.6